MAEEEGSLTDKAQYAILRFAKYKGPEISNIEAHNERMKETYASNPDVDLSRCKYPDLERGESASKTGREHIPPRVFKQASNLNKQAKVILDLLADTNPLNARKNAAELDRLLRKFFPEMGKFLTKTKQYDQAIRSLKAENADLKQDLKEVKDDDMKRRLAEAQLKSDYIELERTLQKIPPEIVFRYSGKTIEQERGNANEV